MNDFVFQWKENSVNIVTKAHPHADTVMSDASHLIQVIMINRGEKRGDCGQMNVQKFSFMKSKKCILHK